MARYDESERYDVPAVIHDTNAEHFQRTIERISQA